jgi:hypothetical protein
MRSRRHRHQRLALVTCVQLPHLDADTRRVIAPLAARGIDAVAAVWDDPSVDWSSIDLAVIRSCWDYVPRRAEFLAWTRRVPRLANTPDVIEWNTDKRYLRELEVAGLPVVPTQWLRPGDRWLTQNDGEIVVKPAISICSLNTGRFRLPAQRALAEAHIQRIHESGREAMLQPYLHDIDAIGETSLVFFGGAFSHAVRKGPVLVGPDDGIDRRFTPDGGLNVARCEPTPEQLTIARHVLGFLRAAPLYARVDLVGSRLMELELTEPNLFLGYDKDATERFVAAISEWNSGQIEGDEHYETGKDREFVGERL